MSDGEPRIRARIREIVAELNKALGIARDAQVPVQIEVIKTLGAAPQYSVAMVEAPAPEPDASESAA